MGRLWILLIVLFCACSTGDYVPTHEHKYNYKIIIGFDTIEPMELWVYKYNQIGQHSWEYLETRDSRRWNTLSVYNKNVMIITAPKD